MMNDLMMNDGYSLLSNRHSMTIQSCKIPTIIFVEI